MILNSTTQNKRAKPSLSWACSKKKAGIQQLQTAKLKMADNPLPQISQNIKKVKQTKVTASYQTKEAR